MKFLSPVSDHEAYQRPDDLALVIVNRGLRLDDNPALQAASTHNNVIVLYLLDEATTGKGTSIQLGPWAQPPSEKRQAYLSASLTHMDQSLRRMGQSLWVLQRSAEQLVSLIQKLSVRYVYSIESAGYNEEQRWRALCKSLPDTLFLRYQCHSLYKASQLPCSIVGLPGVFTPFRKKIENCEVLTPLKPLAKIPPAPLMSAALLQTEGAQAVPEFAASQPPLYFSPVVPASNWQNHLEVYFSSEHPSTYKTTRNQLQGMFKSSDWSVPLAYGLVSVRTIKAHLQEYENQFGANDSTYWLWFELLWREYFFWYSCKWGAKLFSFSGVSDKKPLTTFNSHRFKSWCSASTPYPLVNACINELKTTGVLSNRGRQIVASCLVNELGVDWRYGAAFFEQHLLDYEVGSNWGNWQYIAGVGADPRGGRHFDLEKQTRSYDPKGEYIHAWQGRQHIGQLNNVDMVDWPISEDELNDK